MRSPPSSSPSPLLSKLSIAKQTIVLFPNNLLEEVENIDEDYQQQKSSLPTRQYNFSDLDAGISYDSVFPIYGRDLSTVRSPPLVSSLYHFASSPSTRTITTQKRLLATTLSPLFLLGGERNGASTVASTSFTTPANSSTVLPQEFDWGLISEQVESSSPCAIALALFLLIFPVITVFGNLLVVLSIATERSLRSSTNYYIVSLAFADILVGALVMPFAVYVELAEGVWRLGNFACDLWIACDVLACTASILNLVAISVDRLLAVTKPVAYSQNKSFIRVWFSIVTVWVASAIIASPIILGANNMANRQGFMCTFYNAEFIMASSFGSFYIPSIAIVAPYFVIFRTLQRRALKMHRMRYGGGPSTAALERVRRSLAAINKPNALTDETEPTSPTALSKDVNEDPFGGVYIGPPTVIVTKSTSLEPELTMTNNNKAAKSPPITPSNDTLLLNVPQRNTSLRSTNNFGLRATKSSLQMVPHRQNGVAKAVVVKTDSNQTKSGSIPSAVIVNTIAAVNYTPKMKRAVMTKERRATIMAVVVLALFFGCWVPFFTANTVNAVCIRFFGGSRCVAGFLMSTFVWLGYINSLMNPIVYAVFNFEFRKAFKKLLHLEP